MRSNSETPECYEVVAANKEILEKSSSGGAFSLLAHEVFEKGGCVFGAAWTDDFSVEHIMIDNENDMYKLRKSKYLQSYVGDTFRKVKEKLEEEKICFI
ncbi:MAG: coenzyme F420 hydrogenase/dehydrogenase beta subunit N-terminal domain-containing protein [Dorea sp.]